jgi:hypothetical protein
VIDNPVELSSRLASKILGFMLMSERTRGNLT